MYGVEFKPSSERMAEEVARALRRWRKRREDEAALGPLATPPPPPFTIALSCAAGANGPEVARATGERLGWPVYDHELVEWVARDLKVRAEVVESVDEKRVGWLQEVLLALLDTPGVSGVTYVHHLLQTLLALAAHGECVIVGRGAAQVLPPETTLRVRLVGPRDERVAATQRHLNLSREEADRWVEQKDSERRAFVLEYFRKDPTDPEQYDLLLNVFRFPAPECAELIGTALRRLQERAQAQAATPGRAASTSDSSAGASVAASSS